MNETVINTWQDEEDSGNKCQDGALWANMAHVAKDEGSEHKEQRHHRERRSCPHHFWERTKEIRCVSDQEISKSPNNAIYSLRIFAVFSVVISISGSVKYSEATHFPFSEPERETEHNWISGWWEGDKEKIRGNGEMWKIFRHFINRTHKSCQALCV